MLRIRWDGVFPHEASDHIFTLESIVMMPKDINDSSTRRAHAFCEDFGNDRSISAFYISTGDIWLPILTPS